MTTRLRWVALVCAVVCVMSASVAGCASAGQHVAGQPHAVAARSTSAGAHTVLPSPAVSTPPASVAAKPRPRPTACAANSAAQLVKVSLRVQHLWMCARRHLVYSTPITSGMAGQWTQTPTGRYVIQGFTRNTTLTLNTGAQYAVKYWIPFDGPLFGFHDSSWQQFPYGSAQYRTDGSHGCVHMPLKAIAFLYKWARVGAAVSIH